MSTRKLRSFLSKTKRKFITPKFPVNDAGKIYLHLGCGEKNNDKFINVDAVGFQHVHYISNIDNLEMFKDDSVDLIYACHCFEHFSHASSNEILRNWYRILKKGGILRLAVPDFDGLVDSYLASGRDIKTVMHYIMGGQDNKFNFHYSIFNKAYLDNLLSTAGFHDMKLWENGQDDLSSFDDYSKHSVKVNDVIYKTSLNIEAVK